MLFKLSLRNIRKSLRDYAIYFFTLFIGVSVFYVFNAISGQAAALRISQSADFIIELLDIAISATSVAVAGVLGLLIVYASRFLMKRRSKEFALYMLLGMGKGKIGKYVTDFPTPSIAGHDNCLVIPHLGASTEESEDNCAVMAVHELRNYLENGNINNSVNYPQCDMGLCRGPRIAIFHKNSPGMLGQFTKQIGDLKYNISDLSNKSRGEVAYTLIDLENNVTAALVKKLEKIKGVFRVRVVREKV